ncbi:hypothetical protein ACFL6S_20135 [Candidatus Poribacteria bacterium]
MKTGIASAAFVGEVSRDYTANRAGRLLDGGSPSEYEITLRRETVAAAES